MSGKGCQKQDVLIEDGRIKEVASHIDDKEAEVTEVCGKYLFPGFIDAHTHFDLEVSGTVTADGFRTGTEAALIGGTTMIIDFATQYKGESLSQALENWHKKSDGLASCDYSFHLAISDWNPLISQELKQIVDKGVTSFKLYMTYPDMVLDDESIYQVLKRLKEVGGIAGVHCENKGLIDALTAEEKSMGHMGTSAHPRTRPALVEAEAVGRLLKIAGIADTPVIVVHLSSGAGLKEIRTARERGQLVMVETCPQYLLMDDSLYELPDFEGAKYIIAPPVRKREDRERLWEALKEHEIQTISTDHCSFTKEQKAAGKDDFTKIPCGMPGVENRPVLMYTYGVLKHGLALNQMCKLLSENPAKLYGLYPQKGCITPGSDADIVVWNPDAEWVITKDNQIAHSDYSPYEGTKVFGKAEQVYLHGRLAVNNGAVVLKRSGSYVARKRWMKPD